MTRKLNNDNGLQDWKTEHQAVTKCSGNKAFSGNLSILPRSNFGVFRQENSPQSLTGHTAKCKKDSATLKDNINSINLRLKKGLKYR